MTKNEKWNLIKHRRLKTDTLITRNCLHLYILTWKQSKSSSFTFELYCTLLLLSNHRISFKSNSNQSLYLLKLYQQKVFFVEINLHKKLLVSCSYNLHTNNISNQLQTISKSLDLYLSQYGNIIIVGDFNVEIGGKLYECFLWEV